MKSADRRLDALERVMSVYETQLLRYAGRIASNPSAAQDIVQETFVRLVRKWHAPFEPGPAISSWLYRVAHNCAVDFIRRESRASVLHGKHAEQQEAAADPEIDRKDGLSDRAILAMNALKTLNDREQQLVVLKVMEEKSYREISEITGLSTGNVGYILHHAMKKLAVAISRMGDEHEQG
jgi:RNA polymerase sigma-70 factor (ECF subfamily)